MEPAYPPDCWQDVWAPYDESTYRTALAFLKPGQTVLDIGAGDLRFARRAAQLGCTVYAVERQREVVERGMAEGPLPSGLAVVVADARVWPFPLRLDAAVLLMRHCRDYALYVRKLRAAGCQLLITNARWGMGVEGVPLHRAAPYRPDRPGWYGCVVCGRTGFVAGPPERLTEEMVASWVNVEGCPGCRGDESEE